MRKLWFGLMMPSIPSSHCRIAMKACSSICSAACAHHLHGKCSYSSCLRYSSRGYGKSALGAILEVACRCKHLAPHHPPAVTTVLALGCHLPPKHSVCAVFAHFL